LKSTCFSAVASSTVAYNKALQVAARLLLEFMMIVLSNLYEALCLAFSQMTDFSASLLALFTLASTALEFLAA